VAWDSKPGADSLLHHVTSDKVPRVIVGGDSDQPPLVVLVLHGHHVWRVSSVCVKLISATGWGARPQVREHGEVVGVALWQTTRWVRQWLEFERREGEVVGGRFKRGGQHAGSEHSTMLAFLIHRIICKRIDANCSLHPRVFQGIESIGKQ
jgi:hypothetical protein